MTIAHREAIAVVRASRRGPEMVENIPDAVTTLGAPGAGGPDLWGRRGPLPGQQRQARTERDAAGGYAEIAVTLGGTVEAARRPAAVALTDVRKNDPGAITSGASS